RIPGLWRGVALSDWNGDRQSRAGMARRRNGEGAAEHSHALIEAHQPEPAMSGRRSGFESASIILDLHRNVSVAAAEAHPSRPRLCMLHDVVQRLLRDTVQTERSGGRDCADLVFDLEAHADAGFRGHLATADLQRLDQTEMLQQTG